MIIAPDEEIEMDPRERIEQFLEQEMWTVSEWREDEDGPLAIVGRALVVEDDEDVGLYADDEGELSVSVVGAAQYGNERIHVGFMPNGYDGQVEVRDLDMIERI